MRPKSEKWMSDGKAMTYDEFEKDFELNIVDEEKIESFRGSLDHSKDKEDHKGKFQPKHSMLYEKTLLGSTDVKHSPLNKVEVNDLVQAFKLQLQTSPTKCERNREDWNQKVVKNLFNIYEDLNDDDSPQHCKANSNDQPSHFVIPSQTINLMN